MANSSFVPTVLTVSGSSSTSSGEKNYVTATDGNASGLWVASSANVAISTSTTTLPDNITKTTSLSIARSAGTSDYARYRFTLDQADYGKKFKISWDQVYTGTAGDFQLQVWSNTASNYGGTSTQLTVQTAAIPAITGSFVTSVDMPGSTAPYIEIRIVATAGTTLYLGSILMGPGTITQGAVISEWQSWTPTGSWTSNTTYTGRYRRVGNIGEFRVRLLLSGAPTATSLTISLSALNLTIDTSALAQTVSQNSTILGFGKGLDSGTTDIGGFQVYYSNTTSVAAFYVSSTTGTTSIINATSPITFATNDVLDFYFSAPIAEFSGSGTLNLGAGAQVEYAAWNGTTTVYGPSGAAFPSITASAVDTVTIHTITWQYPKQANDAIWLEINPTTSDDSQWVSLGDSATDRNWTVSKYQMQSTGAAARYYGIGYRQGTSTTSTVEFGNAGMRPAAAGAYGSVGDNWTTGYRYRLCKLKPSSPVGFGLASATASGLVSNEISGTFTASMSGGFSANPADQTYYYSRIGKVVTIWHTQQIGTSNATTNPSISGLPAAITPSQAVRTQTIGYDNSTIKMVTVRIETNNTITVGGGLDLPNASTNTNSKGLLNGSFTYLLP